ncbi:unnamed protein product [Urochloa decumbens]|uniref:F-box domain-containing protein n=1 Tax=Urochloa decumbens TaxID=240449 RepID=A0ABC9D1M5_9POAL
MAQAQPRTPPELIDDAIREILVRIPPDESAYLAGASLVCKLWRRILSDSGFIRRYREFHRTPPLVGFFHNTNSGSFFFPTMVACPFHQPPAFDCRRWDLDPHRLWALDCRHGRVLLRQLDTLNLLVWNPITGNQEEVHKPDIPYVFYSAMVVCAAAGCDHGGDGCRGDGPFLVVFVGTRGGTTYGCVYSSEARAWGTPTSICLGNGHLMDPRRGALVGDDAYFVVWDAAAVLKYDLDKNRLSTIDLPDEYNYWNVVVMPADDGSSLGLAGISASSNLCLWSRKANPKGVARFCYQYIAVASREKIMHLSPKMLVQVR